MQKLYEAVLVTIYSPEMCIDGEDDIREPDYESMDSTDTDDAQCTNVGFVWAESEAEARLLIARMNGYENTARWFEVAGEGVRASFVLELEELDVRFLWVDPESTPMNGDEYGIYLIKE